MLFVNSYIPKRETTEIWASKNRINDCYFLNILLYNILLYNIILQKLFIRLQKLLYVQNHKNWLIVLINFLKDFFSMLYNLYFHFVKLKFIFPLYLLFPLILKLLSLLIISISIL